MSPAQDSDVSEHWRDIGCEHWRDTHKHTTGSEQGTFVQREELEMQFSKNIGETAMVSVQLSQTSLLTSYLIMSPAFLI